MADVKNIITLGIGASPGGLVWLMTTGLEAGAAVLTPTSGARKVYGASPRLNVPASGRHHVTPPARGTVDAEG